MVAAFIKTTRGRLAARTSVEVEPAATIPVTAKATAVTRLVVGVILCCVVVGSACSSAVDSGDGSAGATPGTIRSSGALAFGEAEPLDDRPEPAPPQFFDEEGSAITGPGAGDTPDPGDGGLQPDDEPELFTPAVRPDGIEILYVDRVLGPALVGSTMEEISQAFGPLYVVSEEPFIREGFPGGYSVSRSGEVQFWAIEENGLITTIMTTNPKVGLDSGLRPGLPLVDAVALHGEPTLTIGPELREFARFEDGTGDGAGLSVLVAIGRFGGPVGIYDGGPSLGRETDDYLVEEANIKELWFTAPPPVVGPIN